MPNQCRNLLTVTGPAAELDRFLAAARHTGPAGQEQAFSLRSLVPLPAHLDPDAPVSRLHGESWYTWCLQNWGTKWDVQVTTAARPRAGAWQVRFTSAWNAPEPAFSRRITPDFPALTFRLHTREEDGSRVAEYRWRAGRLEVRRAKRLFWGLGCWRPF